MKAIMAPPAERGPDNVSHFHPKRAEKPIDTQIFESPKKKKSKEPVQLYSTSSEVPPDPYLQQAVQFTKEAVTEILNDMEQNKSNPLKFKMSGKIQPKIVRPLETAVRISLLSGLPHPKNVLPARFNINLVREMYDSQTTRNIKVFTSYRRQTPIPKEGEKYPPATFIRTKYEEQINDIKAEFLKNDREKKLKEFKKEIENDMLRAVMYLSPTPEPSSGKGKSQENDQAA
jgi:hypothetical protein